MKTIKLIDLLNKIANGEEIPKKIKYDGHIFEYEKDIEYICIDTDYLYNQVHINQSIGEIYRIDLILNNEVEIIEDTPKVDISDIKWGEYVIKKDVKKCSQEDLRTYISLLMETQNEIINYLKSKGE